MTGVANMIVEESVIGTALFAIPEEGGFGLADGGGGETVGETSSTHVIIEN